uniref:2-phosphoglycerate kinase n=1 Tax=Oryza nivara TaxID=4536 RepID=A0A0E0I0A6_ORYNI
MSARTASPPPSPLSRAAQLRRGEKSARFWQKKRSIGGDGEQTRAAAIRSGGGARKPLPIPQPHTQQVAASRLHAASRLPLLRSSPVNVNVILSCCFFHFQFHPFSLVHAFVRATPNTQQGRGAIDMVRAPAGADPPPFLQTRMDMAASSSSSSLSQSHSQSQTQAHKVEEEEHAADPPSPSRNASSKYDFVKVKVWLGENADHYYVLSRFLLCRMLTVTKIPNHVAIKIALELKKLLVDNSLLDVYAHLHPSFSSPFSLSFLSLLFFYHTYIALTAFKLRFQLSQSDLEANLFKLMEKRGYGEDYINRYKMMTRFHHQRVPLVVLVCGTACTGKSTIATQLAGRLNLPNVLQTDMVYELLRTSTDAPLTSVPVWAWDFDSPEELITEFCRECRVVRKGLAGDLKKAMKDGKPIIIEGIHLDPSIYFMDEEKRDDNSKMEKKVAECEKSPASVESKTERQQENELHEKRMDDSQECMSEEGGISEGLSCAKSHVISSSDSAYSKEKNPRAEDEGHKDLDLQKNNTTKKDKPAAEPIVVPIVLRMSDFDHKALLEEWTATRASRDNCLPQDHRKLINNLKLIQDYLCSFESQGLTVVDISANSFPQTLDWLHSYLLQN